MVKERWYRHPVGFGRKGLSQLFEGFFKVRSPGWVGGGEVRMFQSNNYILLAAPPRVRNGHKAFIPPVFECLHGHIKLIASKHGEVVSTPDCAY
jgi:hypothetical protein